MNSATALMAPAIERVRAFLMDVRFTRNLAWLLPSRRTIFRVRPKDSDLVFFAYRRDVSGRKIARYGVYEPALTSWLGRHLERSPRGIFVDVGANMGWHTIHAARHAAVETVAAFEPDIFNAWLLSRNLSLNKVENVLLCAYALGAAPGTATLHSFHDTNLGRHSILANYGAGTKSVPLCDLDGALDNLGLGERRVVAIKIDVEGYEPAVVQGARRALMRADVVIHEYTPSLSREGNLSVFGMIDQLYRSGLKPFALAEDGELRQMTREDLGTFEHQMDVIWTRG